MRFNRRHGRAYKDSVVREFEDWLFEFSSKMRKQWEEDNKEAWDTKGKYKLKLKVIHGTKHRFDLQNTFDCICDAMEGVFYEDDSQIVQLEGEKVYEKGIEKFVIELIKL